MRALAFAVFAAQVPALAAGAEAAPRPSDLLAAGLEGDFANEVWIELSGHPGVGNRLVVGYRYYFEEILDDDQPYALQPFLQKAAYAEGALQLGPQDAWLVALGGRYMFADAPLGVSATAGLGKALADADLEDYENFIYGGVGFDFYVVDEFAIEAVAELGNRDYNSVQAGVRFLARVVRTGDTLEFYVGYRGLSMKGIDDVYDWLVDFRYFFDKHLFAGLEVATDTGLVGVSGGYNSEKGLLAKVEFGTVNGGAEPWGDFLRMSVGLRF